ncbi:hypothetical protein [Nocardiopsis sp. YSL2]|uniref:hypothetical protein n=1 Tax=Nocardiopsis sp. YSL2 TaxID=2939492 RepID=UPI0026F45291|nr:hypothetical protein [Nocardiopsis sp. YSL2]
MRRIRRTIPAQEEDAARWMVRRLANRHDCPGTAEQCGDWVAHRRDVAAALDVIAMLDIADEAPAEPAHEKPAPEAAPDRAAEPRHPRRLPAAHQEPRDALSHLRAQGRLQARRARARRAAYDVAELADMPESTLTAVLEAGQHPAERTDSDAHSHVKTGRTPPVENTEGTR